MLEQREQGNTMFQELSAKSLDPAADDLPSANSRDGAKKRRDPNEPAAVVGIGASAGGIGVLQHLFSEMPNDSGLAFVVVMHLSPEHESNLASIIQQRTSMPVSQVNEAVKVQPNHVYVIPPNKQLAFEDSKLMLIDAQSVGGRRVTIDLFFRTLAQSYGQRAVCIILSGSDSDGVIGLKHVRAQGGVTIAQDPNEAEHESMPLNAISTGMVDWVLPVGQMPEKLTEFVRNEHRMKLPPELLEAEKPDAKEREAAGGETVSDETRASADEKALADVLAHLRAHTSHDFSHYKRATVLRRIARRMQVNSVESIQEYLEFLRKHPAEGRALLSDLLIGVTHFFRDRDAFAALEAHIPQFFAGKSRDDTVRVWVAGCATGEEAYSLAMLLCEQADRMENPPKLQVLASDIDDQAIHEAREGLYPSMIEADVSHQRLRHFFQKDNGRYRVKKELRERVLFAAHDALADAPFSRIDLISCRNLLIYLTPKAQNRLFDIFHFALRAGGLLFVGGAEGGQVTVPLFSPVDAHHRIYVRRSVPRPAWQIPTLPLRAGDPKKLATIGPRPRKLPALSAGGVETASTHTAQTRFDRQERRAVLFGELHLKLLEEYGPPSVVVNETHNVVHLSTNAGRYLQFVAGEPSANVVTLVRPELRVELRSTLFRAAQTGETVKASPVALDVDGKHETIAIEVRPIHQSDAEHGYFLIFFQTAEAEQAARVPAVEPAPPGEITTELENEIQFLKNQLNSTIEQYEATSEELKASNEELQAMNEEMRSATEELETSKEELQSVNEELITVNNELKSNVEELSRANTDLNNLMASTDIGTIFLDRKLRIARFTPSAQKIFNLLPADVGRPISDITHRLTYDGFIADAAKVHDELQTIEREVRVGEDKWYIARIAPYRTADDHIAGVVVTFIDITERKNADEDLRASENRLRVLADAIPQIVWTNSSDGTANYFNQRWYAFTGLTYEQSVGPGWQKVIHPEDAAATERWRNALEAGEVFQAEFRLRAKGGNYRWFISRNVPLRDGEERVIGWFGTATDIHDLKEAEAALRESEERLRQFGENSADVLWIVNAKTQQIEYLSPAVEKVSGESREQIMHDLERWREMLHPDDRAQLANAVDEVIAKGGTVVREFRIIRADNGKVRWLRDVAFPIRDDEDRIVRIAGIAQDITSDRERTERMRASDERFNLLVEGTPDYAMFLLNPDNVITYWSKGAERVFGWSSAEAVGQSGEIIFTPEDRARKEEEKEIEIALREGRAPDQRWHNRKDGTRLWVDGVMRRLNDENGNVRGFAKVARDATEQHTAQEQLRRAHEELEQRVYDRTRELQAMNETLETEMRRRQELEREILNVTERERARISQDLHDSLCQELTATAFLLKSQAKTVAKDDPEAAESMREAAETVNANAGLARDLARGLHPPELGSGGLVSALRELATRTNERVACRCDCPRALRVPDQNVAVNLYRIAQEAVLNALKHAKPTEIVICIEREKNDIVLSVSDDGKTKQRGKRKSGLGIHMMQYRASVSGGTLTIESRRPHGTKVSCRAPLKR